MRRKSADTSDDTLPPQRTVERLIAKGKLASVGQGTPKRVRYDSIDRTFPNPRYAAYLCCAGHCSWGGHFHALAANGPREHHDDGR